MIGFRYRMVDECAAPQPQANDLAKENERLRQELADKEHQIRKLSEEVAEQRKQIADAEKQIVDLERQPALRKQNSTNSSKPPSSDGLAGELSTAGWVCWTEKPVGVVAERS